MGSKNSFLMILNDSLIRRLFISSQTALETSSESLELLESNF